SPTSGTPSMYAGRTNYCDSGTGNLNLNLNSRAEIPCAISLNFRGCFPIRLRMSMDGIQTSTQTSWLSSKNATTIMGLISHSSTRQTELQQSVTLVPFQAFL